MGYGPRKRYEKWSTEQLQEGCSVPHIFLYFPVGYLSFALQKLSVAFEALQSTMYQKWGTGQGNATEGGVPVSSLEVFCTLCFP